MLDDNDLQKIENIQNRSNEKLTRDIQEWAEKYLISKEFYGNDKINLIQTVIEPLKIKVYAVFVGVTLFLGFIGLIEFFKS